MVILLKGKKFSIKNAINTELSLFKVLGNVNLTTKINSKNWIKWINNVNQLSNLSQYGIIFLASMGTSRIKDQRNRRNRKHIRNLKKRETS